MFSSPLFFGCATALITPFLPNGQLDESALRRLILRQIDAGVDALVLLGTTGEPCTISMDERERIIRIGVETVAGHIPVIIGTGSNDTRRAMDYARQAKQLGAQGQLCVTPYYNKATQVGLLRHFTAILDSADLPMILYNVPSRTGVNIAADTAGVLAGHPQIAGLKEASGDLNYTKRLIDETNGDLAFYCGNDDLIAPMMALGAKGAISVCSNIVPAETRRLTHAVYHEASTLQDALLPLIQALFAQVNPIPAKAALAMMGLIHEELRLPLTQLEQPHRSALKEILNSMHLL